MIFVGFVYLRGNSKENKYFIAYFTLILHKTNRLHALKKSKLMQTVFISEPENQSL